MHAQCTLWLAFCYGFIVLLNFLKVGYETCGEGIVRSVPCTNVVVPARYGYDFGVAPEIIEAVLRQSLKETGPHVSQLLTPSHINREPIDGFVEVSLELSFQTGYDRGYRLLFNAYLAVEMINCPTDILEAVLAARLFLQNS